MCSNRRSVSIQTYHFEKLMERFELDEDMIEACRDNNAIPEANYDCFDCYHTPKIEVDMICSLCRGNWRMFPNDSAEMTSGFRASCSTNIVHSALDLSKSQAPPAPRSRQTHSAR